MDYHVLYMWLCLQTGRYEDESTHPVHDYSSPNIVFLLTVIESALRVHCRLACFVKTTFLGDCFSLEENHRLCKLAVLQPNTLVFSLYLGRNPSVSVIGPTHVPEILSISRYPSHHSPVA
jgi:hypothetical protein